jgi:hypothetical protein
LHGGNFAGGDGMCARVLRYLFFGTLHYVLPVLHDVLPVLHARPRADRLGWQRIAAPDRATVQGLLPAAAEPLNLKPLISRQ